MLTCQKFQKHRLLMFSHLSFALPSLVGWGPQFFYNFPHFFLSTSPNSLLASANKAFKSGNNESLGQGCEIFLRPRERQTRRHETGTGTEELVSSGAKV